MRRNGKYFPNRGRKWWTRERVILGLQRFYADFGFTPTDQAKYAQYAQFCGNDPVTGRNSNLGWHRKYPSYATLANYFSTMREAWRAAGFDVDRSYEEWNSIEDWFIVESCGILPRDTVARYIKRSPAAIKRRLYDLGAITAHDRWGISISRAAHLMGIPEHILRRYIDHGTIPFFKGYKLIYLNPADLTKVKEVDWSRTDFPTELTERVHRALIQRALKIVTFGNSWRDHEIYKFQKQKGLFEKRIKNPRLSALIKEPPPPRTDDLSVGDWIKVNKETLMGTAGRVGIIKAIHYSPQDQPRRDGTRRKCWLARIEFPRLKGSKVSNDSRIHYTLPLECLDKTEKPHVPAKPLSMHPEAVRGRQRFKRAQKHARQRFEEIRAEVTI